MKTEKDSIRAEEEKFVKWYDDLFPKITAKKEEKFMGIVLVAILVLTMFTFFVLRLESKTDEEAYLTSWSVVEGSTEKATVVKSQLGMERHHANHGKGGSYDYYEYASYITIETEDGKTGTFMREQEDPVAGLSVGNDCTICAKRYSGADMFGVTNGDTAYFINDIMVYHITEEELANAFLKDF